MNFERVLVGRGPGVDFTSNDYLDLSRNEEIRARLILELENGCELGAAGSRLLSGNSPTHERVEAFLAQAYGAESALLFSSGYGANVGLMGALAADGVEFYSDELNHASLIDGLRLAKARRQIFRHNDLEDLEARLRSSNATEKIIVTESVFSMDGDLAPLGALRSLADRHGATLVVDEAHATGVFGLGLQPHAENVVTVHTASKALGGQGAFIVSSVVVRKRILQKARSFIYSTGLAPLSALQMQHALSWIIENPRASQGCRENATLFTKLLGRKTATQIVPIVLGGKAAAVAETLREEGYEVRAIRAPTVAAGTERLRITIRAGHTARQLEGLAETLRAHDA